MNATTENAGTTGMWVFHCEGDSGAQPLHCHEEVEFIAVYRGRGRLRCGRSCHDTGRGIFAVICPHEPHAGTPLTNDFAVKVLNVSYVWFEENQRDWQSLWRKMAVCEDDTGLPAFLRAYETVRNNSSRLRQDEALLALCDAVREQPPLSISREPRWIEQAVLLLRERFAEEISLRELAASVGLTPAYFCRTFRKTVGLPPHAYQNSLRVARAKTLLEKGKAAGEVAAEVGFYDQSHLTMHFKRLLGTTPAAVTQRAISSYTPPEQDKYTFEDMLAESRHFERKKENEHQ